MMSEYDKQFWRKIYILMGKDIRGWASKYQKLYNTEYKKVDISIGDLIRMKYIVSGSDCLYITDKMIEEITN